MGRNTWLEPDGSAVSLQIQQPSDGRQFTIRQTQDCEPLLKRNAEEYNSHDGAGFTTPGGETFIKAFDIPRIMVDILRVKYGLDVLKGADREAIIQLLSGSDFKKLRCRPGNFAKRAVRTYIPPRRRSSVVKLGGSAGSALQSWTTGG